jgi:hypothetical protein
MKPPALNVLSINGYLAHKQHLLLPSQLGDVVQTTRDIVALHATDAASPYLSLWARVPDFRRELLEDALYKRRTLAKVLCMRVTMHAVPSEHVPQFLQAYQARIERRDPPAFRGSALLVQAGICPEKDADAVQKELYRRVLGFLAQGGPATARQIIQAVPELGTKLRHDVGKPYEGEFSIGSRVMHRMCAQGLLIRTQVQGSWRSNLYEYAVLSDWLPDADLESTTPQEARIWLIHRYLSAFGPATADDVQWWTGFTKTDVKKALQVLEPGLVKVAVGGLGAEYLILADDSRRFLGFDPPDIPYVFFLPALDPYIMGYRDRRRFLASEHRTEIFDRAGNAVPTVWVNGQVAGAWQQRKDGSVVYGLFEPTGENEQALLEAKRQQLGSFLGGEYLSTAVRTSFTRALEDSEGL